MPEITDEIKNKKKSIPLLDIEPVKTSKDTLLERADRWQKVFEAQLHVDWKATKAMRLQEGEMGKFFHSAGVHHQDMENFKFKPLTDIQKEEMWKNIEKTSPNMSHLVKEVIRASFEKGVVDGVIHKKKRKTEFKNQPLPDSPPVSYYERKPGRKNKRIFVYRFVPDLYFETLGFKANLPPNTLMMPQQLQFTRKEIHEFRRTITQKIRKDEKKPGVVMTCIYCKELFLSRKKQAVPYVCTKHRCRKAKVRKTNPS